MVGDNEPFEISEVVQGILEQLTPMHQSLSLRTAQPYTDNVQVHYEQLWKSQMKAMNGALNSEKLIEGDAKRLRKYREHLEDLRFSHGEMTIKEHNDGEIFIQGHNNLKGRTVDLFAQFRPGVLKHVDLYEMTLVADMLVRSGVERINVFAPFLPYQREDKKDDGRTAIAAKNIFNQLEEMCRGRLGNIVTYDLHAAQAQAFVDRPVEHLSAMPLFAQYFLSNHFATNYGNGHEFVVVSPDAGGAKRAKKFAELLGVPYAIVDKGRSGHGEADARGMTSVSLEGKIVLLIDDMIDTAGSLVAAADRIRSYGAVDIYAAATHALLSSKKKTGMPSTAVGKLEQAGIKLVTTDSIPYEPEFYAENKNVIVDVLSLANSTAKVQLLNRTNMSVSRDLAYLDAEIKDYAKKGKKYENIDHLLLKVA